MKIPDTNGDRRVSAVPLDPKQLYFAHGVERRMQPIITENREKIAELCRAHHVRRLSVFGSAVRDDFDPERSDVDLLVDFEPVEGRRDFEVQTLLREKFIELFNRPVDLIRTGTVRNPYIRHAIESEQETLYAAQL